MNGDYPTPEGNTITISNSTAKTFAWASVWPVCKVLVKASDGYYIYSYDGATSDTGLIGPENKDISHVTFCYNEADTCWGEETAWAEGERYVKRGNWAMYVEYKGAEKTVELIADGGEPAKAKDIGRVTFSAPVNGKVTITVTLKDGAIFYYDLNDPYYDHNLKIQGYDKAPTKTPSPGLFANKYAVPVGSTSYVTDPPVPQANFCGVHIDVALPVDCAE